jgi:ArsR family transcriptional regulator
MASTLNFLRLLTDPTRLRLILLLEQEELSVAELQDVLGMGQSRISSHLAQLKRAGVVEDRRAGKNVYYGLTNGQKLDPQRAKVNELTRALGREMPETGRDRRRRGRALCVRCARGTGRAEEWKAQYRA